jgi:acetyl esterase/lipase
VLTRLPVGGGRFGYYALVASGSSIQLVILSMAATLLALLGARGTRSRRLSLGALLLGLVAAGLNGVPAAAVLLGGRSRGLSLSIWQSVFGSTGPAISPCEVTFASGPGWRLLADVYTPPSAARATSIVLAHGGGWNGGDKGEGQAWSRWLADQGFTVVDIQYRLAPAATWHDSVEDLQAAVEWVRGHAADLGADPERVVLVGRSAGGHLALLAAYTADRPPAAVVALYAPTDLTRLYDQAPELREGMPPREASPLAYVRANLRPTLLIHGSWDELVPTEHTTALADALAAHGAPVEVTAVPFARHAFDLVPDSLGAQLALGALLRFLLAL